MPDLTLPAASTTELRTHLSVPPVGMGPWAGVVVLHEVFGLNDDIREHADRLAAAGYLAAAPDLYSAGGARRCLRATFAALSAGQGPAVDDISAVRRWLIDREDCTGRVGVIGFCVGGGFALLMAARGFDAAAPNYGPPPQQPEQVLRGACPVVGSYGGQDRGLRGAAGRLTAVLDGLGVENDVKEYPEAGHSFLSRHNAGPINPVLRVAGIGFHQPSAEDAWGRILRVFDRHLRGGGEQPQDGRLGAQ